MKKNIRLLDKLAQRAKMQRRYAHGGPHFENMPRPDGFVPPTTEQAEIQKGTLTETDMSTTARMKRGADAISNFSMAPGGGAHGAPTQVLAEMTGVPSMLRVGTSVPKAWKDPSLGNILHAGADVAGSIPIIGAAASRYLKGSAAVTKAIPAISQSGKGAGSLLSKGATFLDDLAKNFHHTKASKGIEGAHMGEVVMKNFQETGGARKMQEGGYMNKMSQYEEGGEAVPGGVVSQIPGSDAVEFMGNKHDEAGMGSDSGIVLDDNTEVEDGETMDKVTMKKGGSRKDYFFSEHLKREDGGSYADHHKAILKNGGQQEDIDTLARMQEHAAGRDTNKIAKHGGARKKFARGGGRDEALKIEGAQERDGVVYDSAGRILYQDMDNNGVDDQTEGLTTYNNTANNVTRTIMENKDVADAVKKREEETNSTLDKETNTFEENDQYPLINGNTMNERQRAFHRKQMDRGKMFDENTGTYKDDDGTGFNKESVVEKSDKKKAVNTENSTLEKMEDKKKDNLNVASDVYLNDYGDIPGYQPGVNHNDMQYYMDDPELQKYVTGHEDFGAEWMQNISPEVLEKAGIENYSDLNDADKVTAYQNAWNDLNPDNKIQVDGKFGEQTIRTGFKAGDQPEKEEVIEDDGSGSDVEKEIKKKKGKRDWSGALVNAAQFLPAAMAFMEKPDYMDKADLVKPGTIIPERMAKVRLERVDFNDQLARNSNDANALNRFIETSGGGPASMVNRMASYSKKQDADMKIKAQEARANTAIGNQEAALEAQRRAGNAGNALNASSTNAQSQQRASQINAANKLTVNEFNAGAKAATKDRRLMAVDNAVKGLATMRTDKLKYKGQERLAQAVSGQTGVYDREAYGQDLLAAGYTVGDEDYNSLMKQYNLRNKPNVPPKKKKKEEESTLARMGGYKKKIKYGK